MKTQLMMILLLAHYQLFSLTGCGDTADGTKKAQGSEKSLEAKSVELPPYQSLDLDLSSLTQKNKAMYLTEDEGGISNYTKAQLAVGLIDLTVKAITLVPRTALYVALQHPPVQIGDDEYQWSFGFTSDEGSFAARLVGSGFEKAVKEWNLYVTLSPVHETGCCNDTLVLTGTESENSGSWTIYAPLTSETNGTQATIDWRIEGDDHRELNLTFLKAPQGAQPWQDGGFINYSRADHALSLVIDKDPEDEAIFDLKWDLFDHSGTMIIENGYRYCWNTALENQICMP